MLVALLATSQIKEFNNGTSNQTQMAMLRESDLQRKAGETDL